MSPTIMAIILLALVIIGILSKKIPMNFVMFVVPVVCMFGLGYNLTEISGFVVAKISEIMAAAGWTLLFGLIFFTMLTETGIFDTIINGVVRLVGNRMNVVVIMIMTTVIGALAYLSASMSTAYLICFPIMIPMFKKFNMKREYAFIICQTAMAAMCFLPWGIGVINSSVMAGCDPLELARASIPWGLCFIPVIILQWIYFAWIHKKETGTLSLPENSRMAEMKTDVIKEDKPNARPKLFLFNLFVFAAVMILLAFFKLPTYLVFLAASIIIAMVDYPKNFGDIWNKAGLTFFNVLIMLLSICFYLAAFNAAPADGGQLSMVSALAQAMTGIFPEFLMKYMYIIFLFLCVPIIYFVPYQIYNTMYPLFISVGASFGIGGIAIIAPFVCNLALATSVTPMNSATYVGCTLCEVEPEAFCKKSSVIMFISNALVMVIAILTGVLQL